VHLKAVLYGYRHLGKLTKMTAFKKAQSIDVRQTTYVDATHMMPLLPEG
jgi:hypothetical protein